MESTLFTTLTPNEEANLSGGKKKPKKNINVKLLAKNVTAASNTVTQTATGGAGGNGGTVTITSGKGPIIIVKSPISANGGDGGDAINSSDNAVGAG